MVSLPLFSLCALETVVIYKVFAFSSSVLHYLMHKICFDAVEYHIYLHLTRMRQLQRDFYVFDIWIQRNQSEIFKVNQSVFFKANQSHRNVLFPKRSDEKQSEKGKVKFGFSDFQTCFQFLKTDFLRYLLICG